MMEYQTDSQIIMSIDVKKSRLRIHKSTLRVLGNPPYLQLLFSPQRDSIVVLTRWQAVPNGQEIRVDYNMSDSSRSFDIYSKELLDRIRKHFSGIDQRGLYRLTGFEVPKGGGVCFPLTTLSWQEVPRV